MKTFLNRVLKFLGLMTVSRSEQMFIGLMTLYEGQIVQWVEKDFGKPPAPDHVKYIEQWARTAFTDAMRNDQENYNYAFSGEAITLDEIERLQAALTDAINANTEQRREIERLREDKHQRYLVFEKQRAEIGRLETALAELEAPMPEPPTQKKDGPK
jgi:hypothetical protein